MKNSNLKLWQILVPTVKMDGTGYYKTKYHKVWDSKVRAITGGLTIVPPVKGQWVHNGEVYLERMIPVQIACTEEQIEQIADMTAKYYDQLAVMYYLISEKVFIKNYER